MDRSKADEVQLRPIMGKSRYGCTNRQKKLPIDMLGGIVCTNSKTILRSELEDRVLVAFPESLLSVTNMDRLQKDLDREFKQSHKQSGKQREELLSGIRQIELQQRHLME